MTKPRVAALFGAGFSKHYGGFLSSDILGQILTHPGLRKVEGMRQWLVDLGDYEKALAIDRRVDRFLKANKGWDVGLATILQDAVLDIFTAMDIRMRARWERDDLVALSKFIERFDQKTPEGSCIFTLNQDLLLERHAGRFGSISSLSRPGADAYMDGDSQFRAWFQNWSSDLDLARIKTTLTPSKVRTKSRFNYIKLHGSIDWFDDNGRLLIMGGTKLDDVRAHPLLKRYWSIFQRTLTSVDRLFICGYGFGDDHVNNELKRAAKRGVEVFVWDDLPMRDMRETWGRKGIEFEMRDALCGYVTIPLVRGIGEFEAVPPALDWFFDGGETS